MLSSLKLICCERKTLISQTGKFKRTGPAVATALNMIRICIFYVGGQQCYSSLEANGDAKKKYTVSLAVLANRYKEYENFLVIFAVIVR